jgi:hypothetical protein
MIFTEFFDWHRNCLLNYSNTNPLQLNILKSIMVLAAGAVFSFNASAEYVK